MELNREQIIKALECCHLLGKDCLTCPYENDASGCIYLGRNALALIKELTEENKAWQEQLISQEEKSSKAYYELACEVENLRTENENLHTSRTELTRVQEENERLKSVEFTCGFVKPHKVLECPIFDEIEKAKADTVREMADRLKQAICDNTYPDFDSKGKPVNVWNAVNGYDLIDQIAKEMLEDKL